MLSIITRLLLVFAVVGLVATGGAVAEVTDAPVDHGSSIDDVSTDADTTPPGDGGGTCDVSTDADTTPPGDGGGC